MSALVAVYVDGFSGTASHDGSTIQVWLHGAADDASLDSLEMVLTRVHADATRLAVTDVAVDVRELGHVNASCFNSMMSWVNELRALPDGRRYQVTFRANPKVLWQRRNLQSLRAFAPELIRVVDDQP
nr:hypothetical protein [Kofleriaceae bacterium]